MRKEGSAGRRSKLPDKVDRTSIWGQQSSTRQRQTRLETRVGEQAESPDARRRNADLTRAFNLYFLSTDYTPGTAPILGTQHWQSPFLRSSHSNRVRQ